MSTTDVKLSEEKLTEIAKAILDDKHVDDGLFEEFAFQMAEFYLGCKETKITDKQESLVFNADNENMILKWFEDNDKMIENYLCSHGKEFNMPIIDVIEEDYWNAKSLIVTNVEEAKLIIKRYFSKFKWNCEAEFTKDKELENLALVAR